tara:strand:+ start:2056 stop:2772 length:717 start_codon:yes stop_codon:yes gene_type:complete
MKLAVIFIGTGDYINFLPGWYESCEKNLVPKTDKEYFVFTDGELDGTPENMHVLKQEHLPWPYITLERFKYILKAESDLANFDYVLFLDADTMVVDTVTEEELFTDKKYIGVHHPCHFLGMPPHDKHPGAFETRFESAAGISSDDDTSVYFQGCLWGGKVPHVISMIRELSQRTQFDLSRDIIAQWHDESQMNKFFCERREDVHVLPSSFAYPEVFATYCNFEPKIVHLAKENSKYHA